MKRLLLFLSLFSMIAQSMEPAIIDVTGAKFVLNEAQSNALKCCKTLKPLLDVKEKPEGLTMILLILGALKDVLLLG